MTAVLPESADYVAMSHVRVRTKLLGGFATVLALMVVVGVLAIAELGAVGAHVDDVANGSLPRLVTIRDVDAATTDYRGVQFGILAEPGRREALTRSLRTRAAEIDASFAAFMRIAAEAVAVVERGAQRTTDGAAVVAQAQQAFARISDQVESVSSRVSEIAATAQALAGTARTLEGLVGRFKLEV
jgi:hypothetical protein